ncbi:hypothetical protein Ga0123462_1764 [Mariprofundus ferrinatatus]|uniref:Pirin N-terminal domain-containing protein n=1 Tax=Mariprofundus ferrinatatus TaxID=1921087 RepID=A0A2K8L9P6_9PROT|nr:pirin family protein [Mariprofundus ferrinatatus]ATX82611.1 hypothetical protein Ga0123462_1764 [Mariprofundus ferrinatatus]
MSISIHTATIVPEGDGVTVKRLMPLAGLRNYDPFVLWDHFDISGGGFPDHPHRGFEAITYLFDGGMNHSDNLGNHGAIHGGGAQRFTAGRGLVHSEFPDGHAHGIQLWINLPRRLKSIDPDYQQLQEREIPENCSDGVTVRTIVGTGSPLELHTEVEYLDIQLQPGSTYRHNIASAFRGFVYAVAGKFTANGVMSENGQALFIESEQLIELKSEQGARLMWCFGNPHHEPINQHGPFVD